MVSSYRYRQKSIQRKGHTLNTQVDSEVIAHSHGTVPESIDELDQPDLYGSLNYLLLGEDGILVRNDGKYSLTTDLQMTCSYCDWSVNGTDDPSYTLFKPGQSPEQVESAEITTSSGWGGQVIRSSSTTGGYRSGMQRSTNSTDDDDSDSSGGHGTGNRYFGSSRNGSRRSGTSSEAAEYPTDKTQDWFEEKGWQFCNQHYRFHPGECPQCTEEARNKRSDAYNGPDEGY